MIKRLRKCQEISGWKITFSLKFSKFFYLFNYLAVSFYKLNFLHFFCLLNSLNFSAYSIPQNRLSIQFPYYLISEVIF